MSTPRADYPQAIASIRQAGAADLDAIHAIEVRAFSDPWSRNSFRSLLAEPLVYFHVATGADGRILGYVAAWFFSGEGEIGNVAVDPDSRGLGVGTALLESALDEARRRKTSQLFLEVRESNRVARAMYTSHGFVSVGRRRNYYRKPVEDALVLRLIL